MDTLSPIPPDDSKETAFDYFNNPYFFYEILNNGSQTYFVTIRRDSSSVLQLRLNAFFQAARAEEEKDGPNLVVFFTFHIPLCKYRAVLNAYNQWKSNNSIDGIDDMIAAPPFGRRGLSD